MPLTITHDGVTGGVALLREDGEKIAVVQIKHDQGKTDKGQTVLETMPRSSWTVHLCSPSQKVEDFETIAAYLGTIDPTQLKP